MPSAMFTTTFTALCVGLVLALGMAVARAGRGIGEAPATTRRWVAGTLLVAALWMTVTYFAAARGHLAFGTMPPPMLLLLVMSVGGTIHLARSRFGTRLAQGLPWTWAIGYQSFRILVEVLLFEGWREGFVPPQMTWVAGNYDVLTGITALALYVVALARGGRLPLWLVRTWNLLGLTLLLVIVSIAVLSMPTPLRVFHTEPPNTWVAQAPFVWLPALLVLAALFGHLLVARMLALHGASASASATSGINTIRSGVRT